MVSEKYIRNMVVESFNSLSRRNISAFLDVWADNATFTLPVDVGKREKIEGKNAIQAHFEQLLEKFPKLIFTLRNVAVNKKGGGAFVALVEWDMSATDKVNNVFTNNGVTVIEILNQLAVAVRDYFDTVAEEKTT